MTYEEEKAQWVQQQLDLYPTPLDAHSRGVLRDMKRKEFDYWEGEEKRVLKDSNRYHDDF